MEVIWSKRASLHFIMIELYLFMKLNALKNHINGLFTVFCCSKYLCLITINLKSQHPSLQHETRPIT